MSYIYDLADTWNAGATTFTAIKMNVTDTASAAGSLLMDLQVGGSSRFSVRKDGAVIALNANIVSITSPNILQLGGSTAGTDRVGTNANGLIIGGAQNLQFSAGLYQTPDVYLARDAANTLAQRNGTSAQAFRVYNTYTDASNGEHLAFTWSSNQAKIRTVANGTGVARSLVLGTNGTDRWTLSGSTGHFLASADNTYDIGTSGDNRPRNIYTAGSYYGAAAAFHYFWGGSRTSMASVGDGLLLLQNSAGTDFSRLQFGGTTSSFPSLKRIGAELHARLADDSAYCQLYASLIVGDSTVFAAFNSAIPAGGSATVAFKATSTANFGVFFGSGAPTLSAAKGSLYLRSDGTTTNDRMYVNTDGATTWTAVTTAA